MNVLYKKQDGQTLVIAGHFNKHELRFYKQLGYKQKNPDVNKHGIRIDRRRVRV